MAVLPELEWAGLMQINDAAWLDGGRVAGLVTGRRPRSDPRSEEWLVLWDAATGRRLLTAGGGPARIRELKSLQ